MCIWREVLAQKTCSNKIALKMASSLPLLSFQPSVLPLPFAVQHLSSSPPPAAHHQHIQSEQDKQPSAEHHFTHESLAYMLCLVQQASQTQTCSIYTWSHCMRSPALCDANHKLILDCSWQIMAHRLCLDLPKLCTLLYKCIPWACWLQGQVQVAA